MRAPTVNRSYQPPERHLRREKSNTLVCSRFTGLIVHQQQHAGDHLDNKKEHGDTTEVIPTHPMRTNRHFLVPQELNERRELIPPIQPTAHALAFFSAV